MYDKLIQSIISLALDIAKDIIIMLMSGQDIGEIKVKELPSWKKWQTIKPRFDFSKFIGELQKRFQK